MGSWVLFAIGSNIQNGWLYVLGASLVGVVVAGHVGAAMMIRGLSLSRRAPEYATAGHPISISVEAVSNRHRWLIEGTDRYLGSTSDWLFVQVDPGSASTTYSVIPRRGVYDEGRMWATSSAPFGLAKASKAQRVASRTIVHPAVVALPGSWLLVSSGSGGDRADDKRRARDGLEFSGVREYTPGDSIRHIHWRSSARGGGLVVKEMRDHPTTRVGIALDLTGISLPPGLIDDACSAAASIAALAIDEGHPAELVATEGRDGQHIVHPSRLAMLNWLAAIEGSANGSDLGPQIARASSPGLDWVLIVTTRVGAEGALDETLKAVGEQQSPIVVLMDAASYGSEGMPSADVDSLISSLAARGASVYRIDEGSGVEACLKEPVVV